uniref:40S ribosomal protein S12 n=1 Tax=Sphenodon punctatus TaxID=8508 RepID=A0A8D0H7T5_SPHPU
MAGTDSPSRGGRRAAPPARSSWLGSPRWPGGQPGSHGALGFRRQAHLCVLASNCDEPMYVKLVEALCAEHQINLIKVDDNKKLGEWVGLCKIDREGKPRKVVGCSCVVVKDYGKESQAKDVIEEYFKCKK